ncbi:hypothetical protein JCM10908_000101 [Rhodotorula pacifica]|uniref:RNA-processing protein PTA1 n=1 Tax=Rhodotorula pacifica TaxID=1495444 RepID=UPI00317166F8
MAYYAAAGMAANGSPAPNARPSSTDLELVAALSSPNTQPALKANAAAQAVDPLSRLLLGTADASARKVALAGFASAYPFLFRYACQSGDAAQWTRVNSLKAAVLDSWRNGAIGEKIGAVKVLQRIIQTQSAPASSDPRLVRSAEPNISLCRPNHPFLRVSILEEEANKLLEECVTTLFTSSEPDLVAAIVTSLIVLVKVRQQYGQLIVTSLTNWFPAAMGARTPAQVKSVEKVVRLSLQHLVKTPQGASFSSQVSTFLAQQAARMERASEELKRKAELETTRKRQALADQLNAQQQNKRRRLNPSYPVAKVFAASNANGLAHVPSVSSLPATAIVDLLVTALQSLAPTALSDAIAAVKRELESGDFASISREGTPAPPPIPSESTIDPLKLDLGADELEMKAEVPLDALPAEEEVQDQDHDVAFDADDHDGAALAVSAPFELTLQARQSLVLSALKRVCAAGADGANAALWAPLLSRLISRGLEDPGTTPEQGDETIEGLRRQLLTFVTANLQTRMELARLWLNEEWFASRRSGHQEDRPYDRLLRRFLEHISQVSSDKDKQLLQFLMDLPEIPRDEIYRLEAMATNIDQMQLGFSTLRELVVMRPSVRFAALDVLLGLCTHADKRFRNAAITTVKRWVPDVPDLSNIIRGFALSLLDRLRARSETPKAEEGAQTLPPTSPTVEPNGEAEMATDVSSPAPESPALFARVRDGTVSGAFDPPTTLEGITQHVELLLALCVKDTTLLRPLFEQYGGMSPVVRESIEELYVPLIRSLGLKHPGVLEILGDFPEGSDRLVLKMLDVLAAKAKLPSDILARIKQVAVKRDLDSQFYLLILPECHKDEIVRYLPRVVALLDGTPQKKAAIRSIFLSVIAPPAHFSSINSLRTRSDSLSPVELMLFLHQHDKEIGLKHTIEAISICFSMSDGFRPEVLAAFMQQVVDAPKIPNLFMRTVIQAVTTYKSLQPFVSTTLLSRLIGKKIWEVGPLWEGFIRLVKAIAPNSFAALLQLPREQLSELVQKQPSLRAPLRDYVIKKGGSTNARTAAILAALDEETDRMQNGSAGRSHSSTPVPA